MNSAKSNDKKKKEKRERESQMLNATSSILMR